MKMKRKRTDSTLVVNFPIGSTVEIQLDDGKWHSGVVVECQTKKYLVQVDQEQFWTDFDLIRTNSLVDQKRNAPFEYRPGQFLRNEMKSPTKFVSDEKISPTINDSNETPTETKRKRIQRLSEPKKSPFVWKPSTTSTIQTRRSSKTSPEEKRNSTEEKNLPKPESDVKTSNEQIPSSEVLIFRPIIRFVESTNDEAESNGIDSRSSSRTSTDNVYLNGSFECQQSKSEGKSSCFLETPPPSLPDIHLTQESDFAQDKQQINKSKRKQDRPQRKCFPQQINGFLDRILQKRDEQEKTSSDLCDPGYLSDEYGEPSISTNEKSISIDLEKFYRRLIDREENFSSSNSILFNDDDDDRRLASEFADFLSSNIENYQRLDQFRSEYYHDETNPRIELISNILKELFLIGSNRSENLRQIFSNIPNEIKTHLRLCLNNVVEENPLKKKILQRGKRLSRTIKTKRISTDFPCEQQYLLSPSSPLTPSSTKLVEQQSTEDLLSPNQSGVIQELPLLPKERDVYEIIHCLCQCQIDNGFMIQCETCLCWSHCECVGVTAACIPAFFKCNICVKAEAERNSTLTSTSIFNDEMISLFGLTSTNAEKISRILFYSRQLMNLREQMVELKVRSTHNLRRFEFALRTDDLTELAKFSSIPSDRLLKKVDERKAKRENLEVIVETIDDIIDEVSQLNRNENLSKSKCPSIELRKTSKIDRRENRPISSNVECLINRLCDDEETREIRSYIEIRYQQLTDEIDEKMEKIFVEHQKIENEMKLELGISPDDRSDDYLSYQTYESGLRTALERFKSS